MQKIKAKKLTPTSFTLTTESREKLGLLIVYSESEENEGVELFTLDGSFPFSSTEEMCSVLNLDIDFTEINSDSSVKETNLSEYPVNDTDTIIDVQNDPILNIPTFRKSERSKVRFYPGYWIVTTDTGEVAPRLTVSQSTYEKYKETILGPYKTFMEVTYNMKKI